MGNNLLQVGTLAFVLASVASGCIGTQPQESGSPQATESDRPSGGIEESHAPIPTEAGAPAQLGSLQGRVVNTDGIDVNRANAFLVDTSNFTKTDDSGRFAFHSIEPGEYTLHIDADKYTAEESLVTIVAGQLTTVRVTLEPTEAVLGFREHFHDQWDRKPTKVILDRDDLRFPVGPATLGEAPPPPPAHCQNQTALAKPPTSFGAAADDDYVPEYNPVKCHAIPFAFEHTVPPGTVQLNITVSWRASAAVTADVRFDYEDVSMYAMKMGPHFTDAAGSTKILPVFEQGADNGHANFTNWVTRLYVETKVVDKLAVMSGDLVRAQLDPFHVRIEAVKGVIPPEKPHLHYWLNGSRQWVTQESTLSGGETYLYTRDPTYRAREADSLDADVPNILLGVDEIIPPGTTRINVWLNYTHSVSSFDGAASQKVLLFRTAAVQAAVATFGDLKRVTGTETPGLLFYTLPVTADEADKFYQRRSLWLFSLANEGHEQDEDFLNECGVGSGTTSACKTTYKLTVEAINENWLADFQAGRI